MISGDEKANIEEMILVEIDRPVKEIKEMLKVKGYDIKPDSIRKWKKRMKEETKKLIKRPDYAKRLADKEMEGLKEGLDTLKNLHKVTQGIMEEFDNLKEKMETEGRKTKDVYTLLYIADRILKSIDLAMKRFGEYKIKIDSLHTTEVKVDIDSEFKKFLIDLILRKGEIEGNKIILNDQFELIDLYKKEKKKVKT